MNFERCAQRKRKENTMTERQQSNNWLLLPTSLLRVLYIKMYFNGGRISRWRNVDVQNIHAYIISPSICTTQKKKFLCQSTAFYGSELFSQRQINKRSYTWDLYQWIIGCTFHVLSCHPWCTYARRDAQIFKICKNTQRKPLSVDTIISKNEKKKKKMNTSEYITILAAVF